MNVSAHLAVVEKGNIACPVVFLINVDWYFLLHWKERAIAARDHGWDVWVLTRITEEQFRTEIESLGFNVVDIPISRHSINPLVELKAFLTVVRVLRSVKPVVLHCITIKPIYYSLLIGRKFKISIIWTFPGLGILRSGSLVSRCVWWFLKALLRMRGRHRRPAATFENFDDSFFARAKGLSFSSSEVVPGAGVNLEEYPALDEVDNCGVVRVLFASRLLRSKGISQLVEAVGQLVEEGHAVQLLVAGIMDTSHSDGLERDELKAFQSRHYVDWLGQVKDMLPVYRSCDIVCLPTSYGEGIPRVLIEGAACARPLVATDVPGCREIIKHGQNGFIVSVGDQQSLVEALRKLVIDRELRRDFGVIGRAYVESDFSDKKVVAQTLALYRRVFIRSSDPSL